MKKMLKKLVPSWKTVALFLVAGAAAGTLLVASAVIYLSKDLPTLDQINNRQVSQSTKIYDRTGAVPLYELSAGERRTVVPFQDIPKNLKNATIAIEDERFYENPAFDWRGYVRAILVNLRHGEIRQGGSTITIQLARNAFLSAEQTYTRKIRELVLAINLGRYYTKDEILALYLNEIPYGSTLYGVEAASQAYFGKPVKDLSLAESALIAAIPKAPTYYSPWGSHTNDLFARQRLVLEKMRSLGMISEEERATALGEKVAFRPQGQGIKAPHFTLMVQDYLVKKYGEDAVRRGGLTVITTLDWQLQEEAERIIREGAERNEKLYGGKNAALVAKDPKTGQVLALVGSRDYFDIKNDGNFNVAVQGLRQPGSALKPFVYLSAFTKGYSPDTALFDVPTEFVPNNPDCPIIPNYTIEGSTRCFHPQNFDHIFRGPVSLRNALAQSVNIPAVKTLYLSGMNAVLGLLRSFGVTTLNDPQRYGLSLVLGGGEVHLSELVGAYAVLSQDGIRHDEAIVLEVRDAAGKVLESYTDKNELVIEPKFVRAITDILTDQNARAGLFESSMNLTVFPERSVALKTGTSNDYRDAWTIGYTPSLVVGVWAGNNNNTPMHRQGSSILAALPMWSAFMTAALEQYPKESFLPLQPEVPAKPILSGNYAPDGQVHSILFWVDKENPLGPPPTDPSADPQFNNWELAITAWLIENKDKIFIPIASSSLPVMSGASPVVRLESPTNGSFMQKGGGQVPVWAHAVSPVPITQVRAFWNGVVVYNQPLSGEQDQNIVFSFVPPNALYQNTFVIEVQGNNGGVGRESVVVY